MHGWHVVTAPVLDMRIGEVENDHAVKVRKATLAWLAGQRSPATRDAYTRSLRKWMGWCDEHGVNALDPTRSEMTMFTVWMAEVQRWAPDTIRLRVIAVRCWLREMALCALRSNTDPGAGQKLPHPSDSRNTVPVTDEQVRLLLEQARRMRGWGETSICLLAGMGFRAFEAGSVTGAEVQPTPFGDCLLVVRKGGVKQLCPIPPIVRRAANRVGWPGADLAQFIPPDFERARKRVKDNLAYVANKAGLKGIHPHALRGWYATKALELDVPLHKVQAALNHADPSTTIRYSALRNAIEGHATFAVAATLEDI